MLRFRCEHVIRQLFFALLLAGLVAGGLRADTIDYADDAVFAGTPVNTTGIQGRSVTLAEVISALEKQSSLRFVFDADRLPMGAEVVVAAGASDTRPLAQLLTDVSTQVAVVFKRRSNLIAVWGKGPDDIIADGASPAPAGAPATENTFTIPGITPNTSTDSSPVVAQPDGSASESPAIGTPDIETATKPGEILQLEKFKVEGKTPTNSQVNLRQKAAVSVDIVTSRDFSKFVASDISDIVIRMPGFSTTTRGSFAVVRGLAERYNPIMLDGIVLPSSDPERQTPELDLFPTKLVDAVVVNKVFESSLPATSSGGAVDLRTRPLPEGRYAQVQFGLRADEGALKGDAFYDYRTVGFWDHLAQGAKDRPVVADSVDEMKARLTSADTALGSNLKKFPIGVKFAVAYEDRVDLGGDGRALGYSINFNYDSSASTTEGRILGIPVLYPNDPDSPGGYVTNITETAGLVPMEGNDYVESEQEARLGFLATLGYAFNSHHILSFSAFISQIGKDTVVRTSNGYSDVGYDTVLELWKAFDTGTYDPTVNYSLPNGRLELNESLHYRQRNLTSLKLGGQHDFDEAREHKLSWALARLSVQQEEPDFWSMRYYHEAPDKPASDFFVLPLGNISRPPSRYWRDVQEDTVTGRLDWENRFDLGWMKGARVQAGLYHDKTARTFEEKSFTFNGGQSGLGPIGASRDELIADIHRDALTYGSNYLTPFATADRKLISVYAGLTLPLLAGHPWAEKLDLLLGFRAEKFKLSTAGQGAVGNATSADFYITTTTKALVGGSRLPVTASYPEKLAAADALIGPIQPGRIFVSELNETTKHPAVALIWTPIARLNVRTSYSETVGRPSFREMGPYFTRDEVSDEYQHGNVYLQTSPVKNLDFRIEYFFPKSRDLVALSLFQKEIERPIERSAYPVDLVSRSTASWFNNPDTAELKGAEIEAAKNFGFLGEPGSWFTLGGNATFIKAEVARNIEPAFPGSSEERRLYDQPEWIANAYLTFEQPAWGFSTTLSWFAISDVLQKVGQDTWSTYVAEHSRFDLTMSQRLGARWLLRFAAKNLSDPERKFIADPEVTTEEVVLRTFKDGRNYSLTATYDF